MSNSTQDGAKRKVLLNQPLNWSDWGLNEQAKALRFVEDDEGNIWAYPILVAGSSPSGTRINIATVGSYADDLTNTATTALHVRALQYLYNPTSSQLERLRTPTTWKILFSKTNAGNTAVWTPAGGKKYRLMGGVITVSKDAACAGAESVKLDDNAAVDIMNFTISAAALVAVGQPIILPFSLPGNGYLAAAADNILYVALNGALTAGDISVTVWGTEE